MLREVSKTLDYGSIQITVTVHGESAWDSYNERALFRSLYQRLAGKDYQMEEFYSPLTLALQDFIPLVSRTTHVEGLNGSWVNGSADIDAMVQAFETFKTLPASLISQWDNALTEANQPPGDPETAPPEALSASQKKAPK